LFVLQLLCEFTFDSSILEKISNEIGLYIREQMKNSSPNIRTQGALVVGSIMSNIKNPLFLSTFEGAF